MCAQTSKLVQVVVDAHVEEICVERFLRLFGSCFVVYEEVFLYSLFEDLLVQEVPPVAVNPAVLVFALC